MENKFLHDRIAEKFGNQKIQATDVPSCIKNNLSSRFKIRRYQKEAFLRFMLYFENNFPGKTEPIHLLFNMATGSGKTLIMAGLILYLYEKGYRNFLFFVNSKNIIEKTKDNFLNPASSKYLFGKEIYLNDKRIEVVQVGNFEGINENDINIRFTTIQGLHSDLDKVKENSLTYEDFADKKTVLLADEAHHLNARTKSEIEREKNWENTVERILKSNKANLLLEFTATLPSDFASALDHSRVAMRDKYCDKLIYLYDLRRFREDRFSKEIILVESAFDLKQRILQAIVLSYYKQRIASKYNIHLKPVILFKAQKIDQSKQIKAGFHELIDGLAGETINSIKKSEIKTVQQAFLFFAEENISNEQLARRLKSEFREESCLSINNKDKEKKEYQLQLNTLEDRDNPIRAIFAVQMLNEGWDVLNLFDIVRCYEARDSSSNKTEKTTVSEAQLIGRGARYFPFVVDGNDDRFRRKFDADISDELRVLEELHYHSIKDHRYISELHEALTKEGLMDKDVVKCDLKLKPNFKKTKFYEEGVIWLNEKKVRDYQSVRSFEGMDIAQQVHEHALPSGRGREVAIMKNRKHANILNGNEQTIHVSDVGENIVLAAIARNPFFRFSSLKCYFPHISSIHEFITSESYLGGLEISFRGSRQLEAEDKLNALTTLLSKIEKEICSRHTDHEGTRDFKKKEKIKAVFTDKQLKLRNDCRKEDDQVKSIVANENWYAFDAEYGTSEEKALVKTINRWIKKSGRRYAEIYLLRNEKHFKIYNFSDGRAFQPDFVLHLKKKNGKTLNYQLFIEPKGENWMENDRWKEEFLKEIKAKSRFISGKAGSYRLIGLPFFNEEKQREFVNNLNQSLEDEAA